MKIIKALLSLSLFILITISVNAQYPGAVSTGTVKGWRVDFYQYYTTNPATFGQGTANATPLLWGYTGTITGNELIGYDAETFSLEYTGVFTAPTAGSYTFYAENVDDAAWIYVDNVLIVSKTSTGNASGTVTLTTGDHNIKVKYSENAGAQNVNVLVAGPSVVKTILDARIMRVDNAKLTGWYKAGDITKTVNYGGAGVDRANSFLNKAPNFLGNGNLPYSGAAWAAQSVNTQINFNPAVQFDGDDIFRAANNQNGLMFRNGSRTMFAM
jgi:PA14 domain